MFITKNVRFDKNKMRIKDHMMIISNYHDYLLKLLLLSNYLRNSVYNLKNINVRIKDMWI